MTVNTEQLDKRISSSTATDSDSLISAISAHLSEDLKIQKDKLEKIIDEAKAALGLAEVEEKLEHLSVVDDGEKKEEGQPVLIKDVVGWKDERPPWA